MFDVADVPEDVREIPQDMERVSARMNLNSGSIIVKRRNSTCGEYGETLLQTPGPVVLVDVEFRVREKAWEKVVEKGARDVCAYALGKYVRPIETTETRERILATIEERGEPITYNPFRSKYFTKVREVDGEEENDHTPVEIADNLAVWSEEVGGEPVGRMRAARALPHKDVL